MQQSVVPRGFFFMFIQFNQHFNIYSSWKIEARYSFPRRVCWNLNFNVNNVCDYIGRWQDKRVMASVLAIVHWHESRNLFLPALLPYGEFIDHNRPSSILIKVTQILIRILCELP